MNAIIPFLFLIGIVFLIYIFAREIKYYFLKKIKRANIIVKINIEKKIIY